MFKRPATAASYDLQASRTQILNRFLVFLFIVAMLAAVATVYGLFLDEGSLSAALPVIIVAILLGVLRYQTGLPHLLRAILPLILTYAMALQSILATGLVGEGKLLLILFTALSGIVLGQRAATIATAVSMATVWLVGSPLTTSWRIVEAIEAYQSGQIGSLFGIYFGIIGAIIVLSYSLLLNNLRYSFDKEKNLIKDLRHQSEILEERVEARMRALQASTEINKQITDALGQSTLLQHAVEQMSLIAGYDYAQILVLEGQNLYIKAATGDAGQKLMAERHHIAMGQGIVGQVAETGTACLIPDVTVHDQWLPTKHIANIAAEAAVPIYIQGNLYGVLDVQHHKKGLIDDETLYLLDIIANQIAVAVQNDKIYDNARLLLERKKALSQIQNKIQQTNKIEDVLQVASEELATLLNTPTVKIMITQNLNS